MFKIESDLTNSY